MSSEVEKKNLEAERGTVFDPNAPKTGPLQNEGRPLGTKTDDQPQRPTPNSGDNAPTPPSAPPGGKPNPTENANPEDFGFPKQTELETDDFFVQGKEEKKATPLCKIKTRKL